MPCLFLRNCGEGKAAIIRLTNRYWAGRTAYPSPSKQRVRFISARIRDRDSVEATIPILLKVRNPEMNLRVNKLGYKYSNTRVITIVSSGY